MMTHSRDTTEADDQVDRSRQQVADVRPLLEIIDLHTYFYMRHGVLKAVEGVSFSVNHRDMVAIVGESGSGKSVLVRSILRLISDPGRIVSGHILLDGEDITQFTDRQLQAIRGSRVSMVFQDPMSSWNPVLRIGAQIAEAITTHTGSSSQEADRQVVPLLEQTGIPAAAQRAREYPHQFSGGMRQRAMIAMGLANRPDLILADEPTTALDVTVQAQIIDLLKDLNQQYGTAILLVTHNMAIVANLCERIIVMYSGRIVESGPTTTIFRSPQHPYTWSLLRAIPKIDRRADRLHAIEGAPPDPLHNPTGCRFHPRCPFRIAKCSTEEPPLVSVGPRHEARCWVLMRNTDAEAIL